MYLPSVPIYLLTDRPKPRWLKQSSITTVDVRDLPASELLNALEGETQAPKDFRDGFWLRVLARHFIMAEFVALAPEDDWLHIENDCLSLITPEVLNEIKKVNQGVAVPFESTARAIPVVVHIKDKQSFSKLVEELFIASNEQPHLLDMDLWALAASRQPTLFTPLPTMPSKDWALVNAPRLPPEQQDFVPADWQWKNADRFSVVFDAAALGQYLGGTDPHNQHFRRVPKYINAASWIDVSRLQWRLSHATPDGLPQIQTQLDGSGWVTVANLHMHTKQMRPISAHVDYWRHLIDTANEAHTQESSFAYDLLFNAILDQPKYAPRLLADLAYNWQASRQSKRK